MKYLFLFFIFIVTSGLQAEEQPALISVVGNCDREIEPDMTAVNYLVISRDKKSLAKSSKDASKIYNNLLEKLKDMKLEKVEYKTLSFNSNPIKEWENSKHVLKGYQTEINLRVETSSKDKIATLLDLGNKMGAEQTNGPQAFVSTKLFRKIYRQCLKEASKSAFEKAKLLADFHEVKLGKVHAISEQYSQTPGLSPRMRGVQRMDMAMAKSESQVQVEFGKEKLSIQLPVSYLIK